MDDPKVDRRTFLKVAGAGVTASAIALAVPGMALGAPRAAAGGWIPNREVRR